MPKAKKQLTEDEIFELECQADIDLVRYHRQYKIMERNHAHHNEGRLIKKQLKVLNIFYNEQGNILTDLSVATAPAKTKADQLCFKQLEKQLATYDTNNNEIKMKLRHLREVNDQVKLYQKKLSGLSGTAITEAQYEERTLTGRKVVEKLENKLDVETKQFCTICTQNKKKRQEIEHLLKERCDFNKIWEKLIKNLNLGKRFMLDLIEQASLAYDQREEWISKLTYLRNAAYSGLLLHISDMREVQRKIDNNNKLQEFITVKCQKRIMRDIMRKEAIKRKETREHMEKLLEEHRELLNNIKTFTGEEKIELIIKNFLIKEETNFALFKYLNDVNREMETLNDALQCSHVAIDEQKVLHNLRSTQQQGALENLRKQKDESTADAEDKSKELQAIENKLTNVMNGIQNLFRAFKCSNDPLTHLLGDNQNINYYNVLLYLQILETNILENMVYVHSNEKELLEKKQITLNKLIIPLESDMPIIYTIEQIVGTNPCPLCVEHELVSDVIDCLQVALNRDQIQERLKERLMLEDGLYRLHNVSNCHLPKSREIIQQRYQ